MKTAPFSVGAPAPEYVRLLSQAARRITQSLTGRPQAAPTNYKLRSTNSILQTIK